MTDQATKPLFLYIKGTPNVPVKKIEEARYVCVPVADFDSYMIVCPECGDKRCPKADDCRRECSQIVEDTCKT